MRSGNGVSRAQCGAVGSDRGTIEKTHPSSRDAGITAQAVACPARHPSPRG